jgi:hypothetical protein
MYHCFTNNSTNKTLMRQVQIVLYILNRYSYGKSQVSIIFINYKSKETSITNIIESRSMIMSKKKEIITKYFRINVDFSKAVNIISG